MENKALKFWKIFAIVLVALNLFLAGTIWMRPKPMRDGMYPPLNHGPGDFITNELQFSEAQKKSFDELRHAHHEAIEKLKEDGHVLRETFFNNLKKDSVDENEVKNQSQLIADNQKQIEFVTFRHFQEVRKLCDDRQKKHFDEIIQDVLRHMSGPPHGRRE